MLRVMNRRYKNCSIKLFVLLSYYKLNISILGYQPTYLIVTYWIIEMHYDEQRERELLMPWLMQGDCLERMKEIPVGSVDMILTDPPYEISNSGGGMMDRDNREFIRNIDKMGMCKSNFDVVGFLDSCLEKFDYKSKFCGVFFCSMKQLSSYILWAENNKLQVGVGVWHKSNPAPLCNFKYLNDVEYWVYIKGNKSKILGNYHSKSMVYSSQINKKDKKLYKHPTIKPVEILEKFLTNHSLDGSTILDPFMGSGSTGVACKNLNRKFIGIELDENYFKIAQDRINNTYY